jgi:hypothetical protein
MQLVRVGSAMNSRSGDFCSRSEWKHSYSNPHIIFVNGFRDDFESNRVCITCANKKNVMEQEFFFESTFFQSICGEMLEFPLKKGVSPHCVLNESCESGFHRCTDWKFASKRRRTSHLLRRHRRLDARHFLNYLFVLTVTQLPSTVLA